MPHLTLTKHHGLGNDFLVLLDPPAAIDLSRLAIRVCDRRRGIGADGLITATRTPGSAATMVLHNADGGRAEMSGNGIRCLGQALVDAGWVGEGPVTVITDAGERLVDVGPADGAGRRSISVEMGKVVVTRLDPGEAEVDTGNPHLVVIVDDPAVVDLTELGRHHADVNVEVVRVDDAATVTMRVHERGVGVTEACGTGSCAIAAATRAWGMTGDRVVVRNPGGDLTVTLHDGEATLTGPAQYIATVDIEV